MADEVRINGNVPSWGSIVLKLNEKRYTGFSSVGYSDSRERVQVFGMGKAHKPIGQSKGKYVPGPVSLTGLKASINELRADLAELSASGNSFGDGEFEISVQYVEGENDPITDTIQRCTFAKNTVAHEENADPLKEDIELSCMSILWNGRALYDDSDEN